MKHKKVSIQGKRELIRSCEKSNNNYMEFQNDYVGY